MIFRSCVIFVASLLPLSGALPAKDDFRPNAELLCYECTRTPENDTCAFSLNVIPTVTAIGQGFRCRVYEMDGKVVARGIVPKSLCTPEAFAQINLNVAQLAKRMNASGPVHASCCNSNKCNVDFCTSEGRLKDCSTLISVLKGEIATFVNAEEMQKKINLSKGKTEISNFNTQTGSSQTSSPEVNFIPGIGNKNSSVSSRLSQLDSLEPLASRKSLSVKNSCNQILSVLVLLQIIFTSLQI